MNLYNEIIPQLFLGDLEDSKLFRRNKPEGVILCVLENRPQDEPFKAYHIPIITESDHVHTDQLDHISYFLEILIAKRCDVLVHCMGGMERSPLAVAYFIAYSKGIPLEEAYKIVKKGRPQTMDRSIWLR